MIVVSVHSRIIFLNLDFHEEHFAYWNVCHAYSLSVRTVRFRDILRRFSILTSGPREDTSLRVL